jgi:transcriptional regulator with XRE-family HTH domain
MSTAATVVREARLAARLTQAELAVRLGTTQSAVARLEAPGANPTVETLQRALEAAGRRLELVSAPSAAATVDETLIDRQLRLSPAERVTAFMTAYENVRRLFGGVRGGVA